MAGWFRRKDFKSQHGGINNERGFIAVLCLFVCPHF